MRTKEKFYENLNNKHVSLEKRVERFEFKDIKTLDALLSEAKKQHSKIGAISSVAIKAKTFELKRINEEKEAEKLYDNSVENEKDVENRHNKEKKQASDLRIKLFGIFQKHATLTEEFTAERKEKEAELDSAVSKAKSLVSKFYSEISTFESSARGLGVYDKVSSAVQKYKTMAQSLEEIAD